MYLSGDFDLCNTIVVDDTPSLATAITTIVIIIIAVVLIPIVAITLIIIVVIVVVFVIFFIVLTVTFPCLHEPDGIRWVTDFIGLDAHPHLFLCKLFIFHGWIHFCRRLEIKDTICMIVALIYIYHSVKTRKHRYTNIHKHIHTYTNIYICYFLHEHLQIFFYVARTLMRLPNDLKDRTLQCRMSNIEVGLVPGDGVARV